jgi:hypothetical protein
MLLAASACVPTWQRVPADLRAGGPGFGVALPPGWMAIETGGRVVASRDGPHLQRLVAGTLPRGSEPLERPDRTASPAEAEATALLARLGADGPCLGSPVTVSAAAPAPLGGRAGVRCEARCRDEGGPEIRAALAFADVGAETWFVLYAAPARHYYAQDAGAFEGAVATFAGGPDAR